MGKSHKKIPKLHLVHLIYPLLVFPTGHSCVASQFKESGLFNREVKTFPWFNKLNFKATERKQKISLYSNKKNWAKRCQKTPKKINARYSFIYLSKASREILMSLMFWLQNMVQYVKGQWAAGHQQRLESPLCPIPAPASTAHQRDRLAFWPLQLQNSKADTSFGI